HTRSKRDWSSDVCSSDLWISWMSSDRFKGRFVVEPVNLSELIQEIHSLILTSLPKSVEVRLDLMPDLPAVEADVSQMQQVIMNLVINGAEAIGERTGGTVLVRTGVVELTEDEVRSEFADDQITPGTYVWLEVQDNGSGMDEATKAKIFDPFFTTKFTGRGLGLAALLGIVKGHKGVLRVHSEPGRGSNFRLLFSAT